MPLAAQRANACAGGCESCDLSSDTGPGNASHDAMSGSRLSAASAVVFLLPLVTALAGASLGAAPLTQILGGLAGLGLGALVARVLTRWLAPGARETR